MNRKLCEPHLVNALIGGYLLMAGLWSLLLGGLHVYYLICGGYNEMLSYNSPAYNALYVVNNINMVTNIVSGGMCVAAFIIRKSGRYIIWAGIIGIAGLMFHRISTIVFFVGGFPQIYTIYALIPAGVVLCGRAWGRYTKRVSEEVSSSFLFPYGYQFRLYVQNRRDSKKIYD